MPLSEQWHTSTFSGPDSNCVQGRYVDGHVEVRDSKDPDGPMLRFTRPEWSAFLRGSEAGEFNLPA